MNPEGNPASMSHCVSLYDTLCLYMYLHAYVRLYITLCPCVCVCLYLYACVPVRMYELHLV